MDRSAGNSGAAVRQSGADKQRSLEETFQKTRTSIHLANWKLRHARASGNHAAALIEEKKLDSLKRTMKATADSLRRETEHGAGQGLRCTKRVTEDFCRR